MVTKLKWIWIKYTQKQPSDVVFQKSFLKLHRKTPALVALFNKVAALRPATLLKRGSNTGAFLWNWLLLYAKNETIMSITGNSGICNTIYRNSSYFLLFRKIQGQSFEVL